MSGRLWFFRRWRPRSLQARQMLAASVGLVAFLALAGYALDAAFADTAKANLRERLKNYATSYAAGIDFTRDRSLYIREQPPDSRFDVPGSGLYLQVVMPHGKGNSMSAEGPMLPTVGGGLLAPRQEVFEGPLPMIQIDGSQGSVYRYGLGLVWGADADPATEFPYTIYVMEDSRALGAQLRVFRGRVWFYLGGIGLILLLLQTVILQWSLRPLRRVITELTKVQRGETERMSERHPRELEPLTDSINAFIESERENLERQRNTLADLAHSLKTPIAVLRTQMDSGAGDGALREELDAVAAHEQPGFVPAGARGLLGPQAVLRAAADRVQCRGNRAWAGKGLRFQGRAVRIRYRSGRTLPRRTGRPAGTARQPAGERLQVGQPPRAADRAAAAGPERAPRRPAAGGG